VDNIHHLTFQATCGALGLLQDDQEWDACLREACIDHDAAKLRKLFVILLLFCAPLRLEVLWERYRDEMSHDTWYRRRGEGGTLDDAYNDSLLLLEGRLTMANISLRDFPAMPLAMEPVGIERVNPLIETELGYDQEALRAHVERSLPLLNRDQDRVVASILNVVRLDQGNVFFLDGPGRSGKMFVYSVFLASIRNEGHVALAVASSGIAALLLQGGRTSHSAFKIPIDVHRDLLCNVNASSDTAELIQAAKLIVWDEAPAQHPHCVEAIDRTFQNVLQQAESPFGRKVIVFRGDFCQCPPVVARGSQPAIVGATLKRSVLWRHVEVLALTENMRLRDDLASRPYAEYILRVGDGIEPLVLEGEATLLPHGNAAPSAGVEIGLFPGIARRANLDDFISSIFPDLPNRYAEEGYMDGRAILRAKNVVVIQINMDIATGMPGDEHVFFLADTVEAGDDRAYEIATEF
jgi:hypothetical protein